MKPELSKVYTLSEANRARRKVGLSAVLWVGETELLRFILLSLTSSVSEARIEAEKGKEV